MPRGYKNSSSGKDLRPGVLSPLPLVAGDLVAFTEDLETAFTRWVHELLTG